MLYNGIILKIYFPCRIFTRASVYGCPKETLTTVLQLFMSNVFLNEKVQTLVKKVFFCDRTTKVWVPTPPPSQSTQVAGGNVFHPYYSFHWPQK